MNNALLLEAAQELGREVGRRLAARIITESGSYTKARQMSLSELARLVEEVKTGVEFALSFWFYKLYQIAQYTPEQQEKMWKRLLEEMHETRKKRGW